MIPSIYSHCGCASNMNGRVRYKIQLPSIAYEYVWSFVRVETSTVIKRCKRIWERQEVYEHFNCEIARTKLEVCTSIQLNIVRNTIKDNRRSTKLRLSSRELGVTSSHDCMWADRRIKYCS